ncbi:MAG TPA: PfkB family carbohydrate kinase [Vicinamibacterales bacterium]|nr:PfkB family carbohydrate kinase [Vicinamibacterales bacterium]
MVPHDLNHPTACDVLGVGANSVDYVNLLPAYPQPQGPSSKMRIRRQAICCGGQTATAMATCASFGWKAKYVGATGTDDNGRRVREELVRRGVDTTEAVIRDAPNQFAVILVDESTGERIVLWDRDPRLQLRDREVSPDTIAAARLVHVDDVDEAAAIRAARLARERGLPVTSDIDRVSDRTEELVRAVTVPIFAEHVPAALTGLSDPELALRKLRSRHPGLLCVTLGARGAMALDGDRLYYSPGFRVHAVDTTGAGDVFRGGFIHGLLQGWPTDRLLQFANAAAAASCTRLGAMHGVPTLDEALAVMETAEVWTA